MIPECKRSSPGSFWPFKHQCDSSGNRPGNYSICAPQRNVFAKDTISEANTKAAPWVGLEWNRILSPIAGTSTASGHNGSCRSTNEEICNSVKKNSSSLLLSFVRFKTFAEVVQLFIYLLMDTMEFQHQTFYLGKNTRRTAKNSQICICFISPCLHLTPLCFQYCRKTKNTTNGEHLSWLTRPTLLCLLPTFLLWFKPFY